MVDSAMMEVSQMTTFDSYATKYSCIHMRRVKGILEMRFHTNEGPLRWGLALASKPTLLLRYTRLMFTEHLKKRMQDLLGYGLALEGLALMEQTEQPR